MLDDPKLMKSLLDLILSTYGYKSTKVRTEIQQLVDDVRADERKKFAKFFYQLLLEHKHQPVAVLLEKVKRGEHESCCREDATR